MAIIRVLKETMRFWTFRTGSVLRKLLFGSVVLSLVSCWILVYRTTTDSKLVKRVATFPEEKCQHPRLIGRFPGGPREHLAVLGYNASLEVERRILIVSRKTSITFRSEISPVVEAQRIAHQYIYVQLGEKVLIPDLMGDGMGRFSVIIFESIKLYLSLEKPLRELFEGYCRKFAVGFVYFAGYENYGPTPRVIEALHLRIQRGSSNLRNIELNPKSCLLRLTRAGGIAEMSPTMEWSVFFSNHSTYEAVEFAVKEISLTNHEFDEPAHHASNRYTTVLADLGYLDGIRRVYFGGGVSFWLHKLLFIDSLAFLSRGQLSHSLDRKFVVDVDDIFVGRSGIRMTKDDVKAMISIQSQIQQRVPGFHFNLGFSGGYFLHGSDEENEGDRELVQNADKFWWFSHMWRHTKPHQLNTLDAMKEDLTRNLQFANEYNIPLNTSYAVAPHHSGVYPSHDILFDAWKKVYNLKSTSTEEYPHLHPPRFRRGFIYKNIKVMPRQTCGLYTHTYLLKDYPKGQRRLESSIYGGELFQVFVDNPISIFMTHLSNYGNDRLALLTFDSVVKYLQCWTNLKLSTEHPSVLAEKYFKMYPEEAEPIWQNPCSDPRHKAIWSEEKNCNRLPSFVVVGPQKTGTTALYSFLSMHPDIVSSEPSVKTYEEVQFFNGRNYFRGLDWYLDFFRDTTNSTNVLLFEKSANYFDNKKTPFRLHALLPNAKIIVILLDPVKRAYSWYQHMKSHGLPSAKESFYKVLLGSNSTRDKAIQALGQRCLVPGLYAHHLQRWLTYFPSSQILILDGIKLRTDPAAVMLDVQTFLGVNIFDYDKRLRFDKHKGFYCQVTSTGGTKCLGKGKGRNYPPMDSKSQTFLEEFYSQPNKELADLLRQIHVPLPEWLS